MDHKVRVHRPTRRVRKFTEALKERLLEHIALGNTLASFLRSIRNSPLSISPAAIYKQLANDLELKKEYQFAREFGTGMIYDKSIDLVDIGFKRPSLAIMKNWWPKHKSKATKRREAILQAMRLADELIALRALSTRTLEPKAKR